MRNRNKYPKTKTCEKMVLEYVNAVDTLVLLPDGLVQSKFGKYWSPPKPMVTWARIFVDVGYIVRKNAGVKGSPWVWAKVHYTMKKPRQFPYEPSNEVAKG